MENLITRKKAMSEDPNEVTTYSEEHVLKLMKELNDLKKTDDVCKKANTEQQTNIDNLNAQFKGQFENLLNKL